MDPSPRLKRRNELRILRRLGRQTCRLHLSDSTPISANRIPLLGQAPLAILKLPSPGPYPLPAVRSEWRAFSFNSNSPMEISPIVSPSHWSIIEKQPEKRPLTYRYKGGCIAEFKLV